MGQGVDREVGPDGRGGAGRFPVERHDIRGQAGTQRPVGVQGPGSEKGEGGPAEAGRCRVDGGRGTDEAEGHHASLMGEKDVERGETRLGGQDREGGSSEAVCNPPLDLSPVYIHLGEKAFGGDEEVGAIRQDREQERVGKAVAKVGGDAPTS